MPEMPESVSYFFIDVFGNNAWLITLLVSILPLIELKGAIPFGMSVSFWGDQALTPWAALGFAFLGSSLIVPLLALIFKPIINWLGKYKFFQSIIAFFTDDIKNKSQSIENEKVKKPIFLKFLSVIVFVAFPVPLTGVWTGTCLAILLGLNFWQTCLSVIFGNFLCGLTVAFICSIFPNSTSIILYIFLSLLAVAMIIKIIVHFVKKNKNKKNPDNLNTK